MCVLSMIKSNAGRTRPKVTKPYAEHRTGRGEIGDGYESGFDVQATAIVVLSSPNVRTSPERTIEIRKQGRQQRQKQRKKGLGSLRLNSCTIISTPQLYTRKIIERSHRQATITNSAQSTRNRTTTRSECWGSRSWRERGSRCGGRRWTRSTVGKSSKVLLHRWTQRIFSPEIGREPIRVNVRVVRETDSIAMISYDGPQVRSSKVRIKVFD